MNIIRQLFVSAFALTILFGTLATVSEAQRRTTKRRTASAATSTAESEAAKFWAQYVPACNGSRYVKKAASIFVELRGFNLQVSAEPLSEADRLNGISAKGSSNYSATSSRTYSSGRWSAWKDGLPEDAKLTNSVRFQKTNGAYRFYGVGYFNDYASKLSCSELPGARVANGSDEVPTNAIQIDDTHVFPIQNFYLWEGSSNKPGPRFSQSKATYIYWKILYQETAFDYRPPQTESYWFKDGKQWSYAESAAFSNTGAGQLSNGKGWDEPGHWQVGKYKLKVYVKKRLVKVAEFEIVDDRNTSDPIRYDGIYRFANPTSKSEYVTAIRFFADGTMLFGRELASNRPLANTGRINTCLNKKLTVPCADVESAAGQFTLRGNRIDFQVRYPNETLSYAGIIENNALKLRPADDIDLSSPDEQFVFTEIR